MSWRSRCTWSCQCGPGTLDFPKPFPRQQAFVDRLVGQCERVGRAVNQWADAAPAARGARAIRFIQGVLALTRRHPRERILAAVTEAHTHFVVERARG